MATRVDQACYGHFAGWEASAEDILGTNDLLFDDEEEIVNDEFVDDDGDLAELKF